MQLLEGHIPVPRPDGVPEWEIDPYAGETLSNLEDYYSELRARGGFVYLPRYALLACGRYHETKEVFSDWKRFVSSPRRGPDGFQARRPVAEAEAMLSTLATRVATIELAGRPERRPGNAIHALDKLPITIRAS